MSCKQEQSQVYLNYAERSRYSLKKKLPLSYDRVCLLRSILLKQLSDGFSWHLQMRFMQVFKTQATDTQANFLIKNIQLRSAELKLAWLCSCLQDVSLVSFISARTAVIVVFISIDIVFCMCERHVLPQIAQIHAEKRQVGQMDLLKQMPPIALRMRKGFAKKLFT